MHDSADWMAWKWDRRVSEEKELNSDWWRAQVRFPKRATAFFNWVLRIWRTSDVSSITYLSLTDFTQSVCSHRLSGLSSLPLWLWLLLKTHATWFLDSRQLCQLCSTEEIIICFHAGRGERLSEMDSLGDIGLWCGNFLKHSLDKYWAS